jgi:hypothetical protein
MIKRRRNSIMKKKKMTEARTGKMKTVKDTPGYKEKG